MTGGSENAVVIGTDPIAADDIDAAKEADRVLFYSFADACDLERDLGYRGEVIDLSDRIRDVEATAGAWAAELSSTLRSRIPWLSAAVVVAARRRVHVDVLWPIAAAQARAALVRARLGNACSVQPLAVDRLDNVALTAGCSNTAASLPGAAVEPHERFWISARAAHEEARRLEGLSREIRSMARSGSEPTAALIVAVPIHFKLLESSIKALRERGWRCVAVQVATEGDLAAVAEQYGVEFVRLAPLMPREESLWRSMMRRLTAPAMRRVIDDWTRGHGLHEYAPIIVNGVEVQLERASTFRAAYRTLLRNLRPQIVLSVSELYPGVEPVIGVCKDLDIPTVNVQHGNIPGISRMSDFGFDAFCVFGEAYKELLISLGTPAEKVRITGSPYLDAPRDLGIGETAQEPIGSLSGGPARFTILFIAGYRTGFSSDALLYESLKMVLEYVELHPDVMLIVKMHPAVTRGRPVVAYEIALAEHPNVPVTVVYEGDAHDMVRESDCVATRGSTVAFEAAWLRKPVILLSPLGTQDHLPLVSEGTALRARNLDDFAECVRILRDGSGISPTAYDSVERRYAYEPDGRAGERIVDICEELAHRR